MRGLTKSKLNALSLVLDDNNINVIVMTETWKSESGQVPNIPGYDMWMSGRPRLGGGGVAIWSKKNEAISFSRLPLQQTDPELEAEQVWIIGRMGKTILTICAAYVRPSPTPGSREQLLGIITERLQICAQKV